MKDEFKVKDDIFWLSVVLVFAIIFFCWTVSVYDNPFRSVDQVVTSSSSVDLAYEVIGVNSQNVYRPECYAEVGCLNHAPVITVGAE